MIYCKSNSNKNCKFKYFESRAFDIVYFHGTCKFPKDYYFNQCAFIDTNCIGYYVE
jgi:hypothetical protein